MGSVSLEFTDCNITFLDGGFHGTEHRRVIFVWLQVLHTCLHSSLTCLYFLHAQTFHRACLRRFPKFVSSLYTLCQLVLCASNVFKVTVKFT